MKILILMTIITWSFGISGVPNKTSTEIVSSPEVAAIKIFEYQKRTSFQVEPDQKKYILYQVDFENNKVTEIEIPELKFK